MKIFLVSTCISVSATLTFSQTINSVAITAGVSAGNQNFFNAVPVEVSRKNYIMGFNASVFAEMFNNERARWVTELQYNQKGSIDRRETGTFANQLQYINWNNYLKLRYELFSIIPYILVGPRLEFNFAQATSSPEITSKFLLLHVSPAVGAGMEFINYYNIKFFVEAFYNPDVMPAYISPETHVFNKTFELRVGLKLEFVKKRENCNAPTFVD